MTDKVEGVDKIIGVNPKTGNVEGLGEEVYEVSDSDVQEVESSMGVDGEPPSDMEKTVEVEKGLDTIRSTDIIARQDLKDLIKMKQELDETYRKNQIFRSRYEIENSVLNDFRFPTPDAKYWQLVREQDVHFGQLVMHSFDHRDICADIELLEVEIEDLKKKLSKEDSGRTAIQAKRLIVKLHKKENDLRRKRFIKTDLERVARDRIREIKIHSEIKAKLVPQMEFGTDSYEDHQPRSSLIRYRNEMLAARITQANFGPAEARNVGGQYFMSLKHPANRNVIALLPGAIEDLNMLSGGGYDLEKVRALPNANLRGLPGRPGLRPGQRSGPVRKKNVIKVR
jgi:hypothetical protein